MFDSTIMHPGQYNLLDLATGCHSMRHSQSTAAYCIMPEAASNYLCSQWTKQISIVLSKSGHKMHTPARGTSVNELVISRELFCETNMCKMHNTNLHLVKYLVVQDRCSHCSRVTFATTMADKPECSVHIRYKSL